MPAAPSTSTPSLPPSSGGAFVAPGARFTKTWRLVNNGSGAWPAGTTLAFVAGDGEILSGGSSIPVYPLAPGAATQVSLPLVAPAQPGSYKAFFRLLAPPTPGIGPVVHFGDRVWVDVHVAQAPPAAASAPPATGAAAPTLEELAALAPPHRAPSAPPAPMPSSPWPHAMAYLASMGFADPARNAAALARHNGNVTRAVHELLG